MDIASHVTLWLSSRVLRPTGLRALGCASGATLALLAGPAASVDLIQGDWQFRYSDLDGRTHAVRLGRMEVYDQHPDGTAGDRAIGPFGTSGPFPLIVTSLEGKASAQLDNFEAGGIDPAGRILAATGGGSVTVSMNFKRDDDTAGANYFAQSPVVANVGGSFSALPYTVPGINTNEGRAFASFDALVTGKRYLEFLGSEAMTINGVLGMPGPTSISPPTRPDARVVQLNVAFNNTPTSPGRIDADVFDWDVLLHEVGHATSFANGFNSYPVPGGQHLFTEILDARLAWSEGYSNFFQAAAQDWENRQPGTQRLPDVRIAAGKESIRATITDYRDTTDVDLQWNIEKKTTLQENGKGVTEATRDGDRNELSIARMLWDLLDGTGGAEGPSDGVTLGHKPLFDLLVRSGARTFLEFVNFLARAFPDARTRTDFGAIFAEHHVAPRALGALTAPPPPPVPPNPGAIDAPAVGVLVDAGGEAVQTPAKEVADAPWYPDPSPDPSVAVFRVGIDLPPILNWLSPWGEGDAEQEAYRLQFFMAGTDIPIRGPGEADFTGDSDWTPRPSLDLIHAIDLSSSTGGSGSRFDTCGQAEAPGYRCFRLDSGLIDQLVSMGTPSVEIYWNVVGARAEADLDDGVWGNVAAFELRRVPEPGSLTLLGAAVGVAAWARRRNLSRAAVG